MNGETDIPTCRLCSRPRTNHSSGCPEGEADRLRARVAELERERQAMRTAFKDEMGYLPSGEGAALVRALIGKLHETWRDDDVRADRRLTLWGRAKGAEVQVARARARAEALTRETGAPEPDSLYEGDLVAASAWAQAWDAARALTARDLLAALDGGAP